MTRIHPKATCVAALAALSGFVMMVGCRSSSGTSVNPFLAPSRVPPPATRALQPGEARPYYPGDPLPVMQSDHRSVSKPDTLAWVNPRSSQIAADQTGSLAEKEPNAARSLDSSPEPLVAIPADNDSLRFAPPVAAKPEQSPSAMGHTADRSAGQTVVPASYAEPIGSHEPNHANHWQPPRIARTAPMLPGGAFQPGWYGGAISIPSFASVPPEPGDFAMPRIRLPSQVAMQPAMGSSDGFRPRGSMR